MHLKKINQSLFLIERAFFNFDGMKKILSFLLTAALAVSCGSQKETVSENEANRETITQPVNTTSTSYRFAGVVKVTESCGIYIDAASTDKRLRLAPLNLEERFQNDGMRLKFSYEIKEGATFPSDCNITYAVTLRDVSLMR